MHTAVATSYLQQLKSRSGFYFVRKVPADLVSSIGKRHWRWKAGNTPQEARRAAIGFLAQTDREIAEHRGQVTPELLKAIDNNPVIGLQEELRDKGLTPGDIYPRFTEEEAHSLVRRESGFKGRSMDDLLELAKRLKDPAPSTFNEWKRHASKLMEVTQRQEVSQLTEADIRRYRDHLLDTVSGATAKTRIRYLKSLMDVAVGEGWVESNPFTVINLRYIKSKAKVKEATTLDGVDVSKLPEYQQHLYFLMRWTGMHVSEAAGLRHEDIDLVNRVIHVRENELRPLKNPFRTRDLPIIDALLPVIEAIKTKDSGYCFYWAYEEKHQRWGNGMSWHRRIGISPKTCRDAVATVLRDNEINERVIGSILGHTPKTSTGMYGSVSLDAKREALNKLQN